MAWNFCSSSDRSCRAVFNSYDHPAPILRLSDIHKSYNLGTPVEAEVLHGISLSLQESEFVALKGPSGSGKSTLLNIIGLLERLTADQLEMAGVGGTSAPHRGAGVRCWA